MLLSRLAWRDLRGAMGELRLLIACMALSTAAICAVGSVSAMVLEGIRAGARDAIGGDVSLRLFHRAPPPEHLAAIAAGGRASLTAELRPLARREGRAILVELKGVDGAYPLYGAVALAPDLPLAEALAERNGTWGAVADYSALDSLNARLGDIVSVGDRSFELRAVLTAEPDRILRPLSLGPRMMVSLPALEDADMIGEGSQTYWYTRVRLASVRDAAAWIAGFEREFPEAGYRIVNAEDGVPGVERILELVTSVLTLASTGLMLIGSVGVGGSVSAYLDGRLRIIGTMKAMGASPSFVLSLYLAQISTIALVAVVAGVALGMLIAQAVIPMLPDWLPIRAGVPAAPAFMAAGCGLLASVLFSLWPLSRAETASVASLFRHRDRVQSMRYKPVRLLSMAAVATALVGLLAWSTGMPQTTVVFLAAAGATVLVFLMLGWLVVLSARRAGQSVRFQAPAVRLVLAGLRRRRGPTVPVVMALGLCLTLLVALISIRESVHVHLTGTLSATAPALVVLNIAPDAASAFDSWAADQPGIERWQRVPFLHGRIDRIGGESVADRRIPPDVAFVIRGDRGLSWRAEPPDGGVVSGEWWGPGYAGPPLASLDASVARRLGVRVGDSLTLNLLGDSMQVAIANLRRVDWSRLDLDFPILLSPPPDPPPHREIAALWAAPPAVGDIRRSLAQRFPESPAIMASEVLVFLSSVAAKAGKLLAVTVAGTAFAALLVLAGTVAAGQSLRNRDVAVFKVLGATWRQVMAATVAEFLVAGVTAGAAALVVGNLAAWAGVGDFVTWRPALSLALPWMAGVLAVLAVVATGTAWRAWALPAARLLR